MNHLTGNHLTGKVGIAKIRLIYGMLVPAEPVRAYYMVDISIFCRFTINMTLAITPHLAILYTENIQSRYAGCSRLRLASAFFAFALANPLTKQYN